jgi:hypothetical protein
MQTIKEKESDNKLQEIPTKDLEECEEARSVELAGMVIAMLIGAIFFILGALTCYFIYGLRH